MAKWIYSEKNNHAFDPKTGEKLEWVELRVETEGGLPISNDTSQYDSSFTPEGFFQGREVMKMIAATPEMLDTLKRLVELPGIGGIMKGIVTDVIAKAEGRKP